MNLKTVAMMCAPFLSIAAVVLSFTLVVGDWMIGVWFTIAIGIYAIVVSPWWPQTLHKMQVEKLRRAADHWEKVADAYLSAANELQNDTQTLTKQLHEEKKAACLRLGDDPRIEVIYCGAVDTKSVRGLTNIRYTQDPDVLARWTRERLKTWAAAALRNGDQLHLLRDGAPVNLINKLEK